MATSTLRGTFANRPLTAKRNTLYFCEDGQMAYLYDGSGWINVGPMNPLYEPPTTGWSWDNQGSSVLTDTGGYLGILGAGAGGQKYRYRTLANATNYTIECMFLRAGDIAAGGVPLAWRDNTGRLVIIICINTGTQPQLAIWKLPSSTTFDSTVTTLNVNEYPRWFRIRDDGTNRYADYSFDGYTYFNFYSEARTTFLTATQVAFGAGNNVAVAICSWRES